MYTVLRLLTVSLSETCRVLYQNKAEKYCILLAFIVRIYIDARSSECQIHQYHCQYQLLILWLHQRYQKEHRVGSGVHVRRNIEGWLKYNFQTGKL